MAAYWSADIGTFVRTEPDLISAALHSKYASDGFSTQYTTQTESWNDSIPLLQEEMKHLLEANPAAASWRVLLEYPLYRLRRRIDIVLLAPTSVFVIELKVGEKVFTSEDKRQVEEYALDLRDFHGPSADACLIPILWCTEASHQYLPQQRYGAGVNQVLPVGATGLSRLLSTLAKKGTDTQTRVEEWEAGPYRPVPSVIDAATTLFAGHGVREIAQADASNLAISAGTIVDIIHKAKVTHDRALIFLAGVPGSGKTLAGLQVVHNAIEAGVEERGDIVYLSGNTPLVVVLREALARDEAARRKSKGERPRLAETRNAVRTRIQHIIDFLREYLTDDKELAPFEHVIVFDEAQRAWDEDYGRKKLGRPSSEPKLLLEILARHTDWCAIVALVGGGQEINSGENGIAEWGKALRSLPAEQLKRWSIYGPPNFQFGSEATAHLGVGDIARAANSHTDDDLELSVPLRSFRSPFVSRWVSAVLNGDHSESSLIAQDLGEYPLLITRSLNGLRKWLETSARGERRCGLVASSGARRLRAEGLGVTLNATDGGEIAQWYLNERGDVRSSFALEVSANEYTTQGLELDFVGLCWGGDLIWDGACWRHRQFRGNSWAKVNAEKKRFITNSYRVLMTRGREGLAVFVPKGSAGDPTRSPDDFDRTAHFLTTCGALPLKEQDD